MRNNEIIISLADESAYNRKVPAYKYGGGDKSNLTIDLSGRPTFNVDCGSVQLPTALLEGLWASAQLYQGILNLSYIDIDTLILWSLQNTGNTVSKNTAELFLKSQVAKGNLVSRKNTETGKTYFTHSDAFNNQNPISQAKRNFSETLASLRAKGAKN